jgi:hypothetical protein
MENHAGVVETGRIGGMLFNLGLTRRTNSGEVQGLISRLKPRDCGIDLIRVGAAGDGGYLIPDDLGGIEYCFSPGVSVVSEFENDLADRGIMSFLADYSVDAPAVLRPEFTFDKKFIGPQDVDNYMKMSSWKDKYLPGYAGDMILQMDIEGAEYEVILSMPDSLLNQFRIIVIEYHFLDRVFYPSEFALIASSFESLLSHFHVAHIHPNNIGGSVNKDGIEIPKILEFTFINKRRVKFTRPRSDFPHPLDVENGRRKALPLPSCWYSGA